MIQHDKEAPIGIFDSGVGGLTVLKEVRQLMPSEDIIYLGDTARVPYGTRSEETVIRYSFECAEFLCSRGIKLLIIACNTASAISIDYIKNALPISVVGVIEPGASAAIKVTRKKKVGIIGTEATIRSMAYNRAINQIDPKVVVYASSCPLFVPLVEEGWTNGPVAEMTARTYLKVFSEEDIDCLVLGCTHYPLLKGVIQKVMGDQVSLVDSAIETAKSVKAILNNEGLLTPNNKEGALRLFVTDSVARFKTVGERFLNEAIVDIEKIALQKTLEG